MEAKLFKCHDYCEFCSVENCNQRAIEEYCEDGIKKLFLCKEHFLEKGKELEEKGIHSNFNKHKEYHERQEKQHNRKDNTPLSFEGFL